MRFRLIVEYDGTGYRGWQVQPGEPTVQGALEGALRRFLGHSVRVSAAGRTDSGVHARGQVACFDTPREWAVDAVQRAVNALTPRDMNVPRVDVVPDSFDPRRHARRRRYVYRIWNRPVASPFWRTRAWHLRRPLCVAEMNTAAAHLVGEHDFTSFRAAGCDAAHPVRCVFASTVGVQGDLLEYEIEATAFLRHMVRNIVGTLVEVGSGRRTADSMPRLLMTRDRSRAGPTAPARGLSLERVDY